MGLGLEYWHNFVPEPPRYKICFRVCMNYTHKYTYTFPPDVISCSALLHNLHKRSVPTRFRWCICICMQIFHNFETNHVSKDRMKDVQVFQKPLELSDPRLIQTLFRDFCCMSSDGSPWYFPLQCVCTPFKHCPMGRGMDQLTISWSAFNFIRKPCLKGPLLLKIGL